MTGTTPLVAGNPAVMDVPVGRPVALRPHLSMGLPLSTQLDSHWRNERRQSAIDRMTLLATNGRCACYVRAVPASGDASEMFCGQLAFRGDAQG